VLPGTKVSYGVLVRWLALFAPFAGAVQQGHGESLRVLYMEATGDGEIFYLEHALEEQPGTKVDALFYDQRGTAGTLRNEIMALDQLNGDKVYRVQHSRYGYPRTLDALLRYDVIICSDVARSAFSAEQMTNTFASLKSMAGGRYDWRSNILRLRLLRSDRPCAINSSANVRGCGRSQNGWLKKWRSWLKRTVRCETKLKSFSLKRRTHSPVIAVTVERSDTARSTILRPVV
jgi:hypothetical protein